MTFNPRLASILPRIGYGNGINDYKVIHSLSQTDILSSYLLDRDPYSSRFIFARNNFERDVTTRPSGNRGPNTPSPTANPYANSNKRILIVDDDVDISRFFKLALERAGFITEVSNNPVSTLNNYKK